MRVNEREKLSKIQTKEERLHCCFTIHSFNITINMGCYIRCV